METRPVSASGFFAPTVKDPFTVDYAKIMAMQIKIGLVVIAILFSHPLWITSFPLHLAHTVKWIVVGIGLAFVHGVPALEETYSRRYADENAVSEYLCSERPSEKARKRIVDSARAAQLYFLRGGDPNKKDEKGDSLFCPWSPSTRLLIQHGFDLSAKSPTGSTYLSNLAFAKAIPDYLKLGILKKGEITPNKFSQFEQWVLWFWQVKEDGEWLSELGFDVNVRRESFYGSTPLLSACAQSQPKYEKIELLLKYGADPHLKMWKGCYRVDAWGITKDPKVHEILDHYKK